jgi:2-phosphosulfolactate phosphatase
MSADAPPSVAVACDSTDVDLAPGWVTVGVDVLRATTTAVTAVAAGRRCFPVASLDAAVQLRARLSNPVLAGELGGVMPHGFHAQNSPVEMERRDDPERPVILLSTTGTRLLCEAAGAGPVFAACLRNVAGQVRWLAERRRPVLLLAGESRGEFRAEDRLCCARIAKGLVASGYAPATPLVEALIDEWGEAHDDAFLAGRSVRYLRETDQYHDVEFTLSHVDDLDAVYVLSDGELVMAGPA